MAPASLSIAIVTYRPDARLLQRALASLAAAIATARQGGVLGEAWLHVIDNGDGAVAGDALRAWPADAAVAALVHGHGNVGYGRANNLVLEGLRSDLHLVMNPDVELASDALAAGIEAARTRRASVIAPSVRGDAGETQYLCRRYPSPWVLFLRGFAPQRLRRRFDAALAAYEMRDVIGERPVDGVPLASGCFMLVPTPMLRQVGGFDPGYFLYFEDYDLSLRLSRLAPIAYVPQVRIVHHGGGAARKGARHVAWFLRSAWRFFSRHGWRAPRAPEGGRLSW